MGNKMSNKTAVNRTAISANELPHFMQDTPKSVEIEEKPSWLNNNLHKLMIGVSVVWFAIVLIYITQFFGWDNLFLMMPDEFGGFLAGITLPLAIIWVVMAYIDRGTSFKQEAKFLRAYMNQLVYPEDGAPQTAKAMADAIRSQVVELQEVSKLATEHTAKIKDEIRGNINEFAKLVATLDNYSSKTIVELSDGVKYLTQNFENITSKAQNSTATFASFNRDFVDGAEDIERSLNNLFEKLLPKLKEMKDSVDFLHQLSEDSGKNIEYAGNLLQKVSLEAADNLQNVNNTLTTHAQSLQNISQEAISNCEELKTVVSNEVENLASHLNEHTSKLEHAIASSGNVMKDKVNDIAKHASEKIISIHEHLNKGMNDLGSSVDEQIKKVGAAMSQNNHEVAELINNLQQHADIINKKLSNHGDLLAQEIDKLMVRSNNLEESVSIQVHNLNDVADQVANSIQKADVALENNINNLQNKSSLANEHLIVYIDSLDEKTKVLQRLTEEAMTTMTQAGDNLQTRRQHIKDTITDVVEQINIMNNGVDSACDNICLKVDESIKAMNDASDNMNRFANNLSEASAVVVAQSQVSEASLAQQHKNITSSAAQVEDTKIELKRQLDELSSVSVKLQSDASSTVEKLKENINDMLISCNDVINKSKSINDNLFEQANLFDTSANRTLAKVTQFESVLNTQNQNLELLSKNVSERVAGIEASLNQQNKAINESTHTSLESFRKAADNFDIQTKALHEISRSTTEYTTGVAAGFDEKAAALNTLFKQQQNEFYSFCDKISDHAEEMSDALKKQVNIIEQSADKVFSRMVMLEEDTSRHTEAVVNNTHRSIDRLSEIEAMVAAKNSNIKTMVDDTTANLQDISQKIQEQIGLFGQAAKSIDEQGRSSVSSLQDSCTHIQNAETELSKTGASVYKLIDEHAKNIDLAAVRLRSQSEEINNALNEQANSLTEVANTLATQSRLGEASLAQQFKYLSDATTNISLKMKEVNDNFHSNADHIFETSTKLAYEFDVLGDRLIKAGEDVSKISKNSMKSMDQVSLSLTQNSEDLDVAVKQSVERIGSIFGEYEKYIAGFNTVTAETSTGVIEINSLISAQRDKMVQISNDTKKLVDCFNTVLNDTSNQLADRANDAYDKVKGLGKDLKNLGLQMEEAAKVSATHMSNSADKLRASISEIAANAERISNDILGSGEVFIKQSNALVAATDDTVGKVNSAMGTLLETSHNFNISSENIIKDAIRFKDNISNQIKELGEHSRKADDTLKTLTTAYQGIQIEGFLKQAGSIIEKLESISVDINSVFNPKDEDDLWKRFYNGDTDVFVRYLSRNITKTQMSAVRKEFEKNSDFRNQINAYLAEFELLVSAAKKHENSGLLLSVISGADIGKLYYILAKIMDKLE